MIIKSHIRGGYRAAADYLKAIGQNEKTRLVEIGDPDAKNLNDAFQKMWEVASNSKAKKPLHHISLNPFKDERLTDKQVLQIVRRCEEKYGYREDQHQRVIVEHIKEGRQHFHVVWNRVNPETGRAVWPGQHWNKSKQAAREMEKELGLKRPEPRWIKKPHARGIPSRLPASDLSSNGFPSWCARTPPIRSFLPVMRAVIQRKHVHKEEESMPQFLPRDPLAEIEWIIAWAFKHRRADILARYGIYVTFGP